MLASAPVNDEFRAHLVKHVPVGRPGLPREMPSLALFLSSDLAGFITGEIILCDGGQSMPTL